VERKIAENTLAAMTQMNTPAGSRRWHLVMTFDADSVLLTTLFRARNIYAVMIGFAHAEKYLQENI
jgi:hypothetical protein